MDRKIYAASQLPQSKATHPRRSPTPTLTLLFFTLVIFFTMRFYSIQRGAFVLFAVTPALTLAAPNLDKKPKYFDVQGHRGTRGEMVESTLPAFALALMDGVTTLELDNGITKDGVVMVWHDEEISATKCSDTKPAFANDPDFPYVGKHIANLTLAQIKTLDCGSKRLSGYPQQLKYPGVKLSTMGELFKFAQCVDSKRAIQWNVESKINPEDVNSTRGVDDFVTLQHKEFVKSGYKLSSITYQSFDWRTLVGMKALEPKITTAALVDKTTMSGPNNTTSKWLAGLRPQDFPGTTTGEQLAYAAHSIKAGILSPGAAASGTDPALPGYIPFATKEMIEQAHKLGVAVKPWTVNNMNMADQLLDWGVDGIITDYPTQVRRLVEQRGKDVFPEFSKSAVVKCLKKHVQTI